MTGAALGWVFAARWEATPFLRRKSAEQLTDLPFPIYRLEHEGIPSRVTITGMGPGAARKGTRFLLERYPLRGIINAGLAGGLAPGLSIGTVTRVTHTTSVAPGAERPVTPWFVRQERDPEFWDHPSHTRLLTVESPVFDTRLRHHLGQWGDLVDMEGAAIVEVCHEWGIPCTLVKLVSDLADDAAQKVLQDNLKPSCQLLADHLERLTLRNLEMCLWHRIHCHV
ncbi:MAG: hypothetical protein HQL85_19740 [Magnetococcales bacterium]|nr:hypothetical protein [Magnetococcales bacterium]MBF0173731.1 hypothetical protein [Magnetococcales bacterium]